MIYVLAVSRIILFASPIARMAIILQLNIIIIIMRGNLWGRY